MIKNIFFASIWLLLAVGALLFLHENPRLRAANLADLENSQRVNFHQLDLSSEQLQDIPAKALQQTDLESFSYDGGEYIATVFDSLWGLENAHLDKKLLALSQRKLQFLTESVQVWSNLQTLNLPNHRIKQLPAGFCTLGELRELDLSGNLLAQLPDSLGYLHQLQKLNLSDNKLSKLPANFYSLYSLRELNLSHNQLQQLNSVFCYMQGLHSLDLSHNQLQKLPASLRKLNRLEWLDLSGNDISAAHRDEIRAWLPRAKVVF